MKRIESEFQKDRKAAGRDLASKVRHLLPIKWYVGPYNVHVDYSQTKDTFEITVFAKIRLDYELNEEQIGDSLAAAIAERISVEFNL